MALALTRELAPVLTGLMVTGRVGSSIATEIGTMGVTEQIDALRAAVGETSQVIAVSSVTGLGLDVLKKAVADHLLALGKWGGK